jgi:hypothetical protein
MTSEITPVVQAPCPLSTCAPPDSVPVSYDALHASRLLTESELRTVKNQKVSFETISEAIQNPTKKENSISQFVNTPQQIVFWLTTIAILCTFTLSLASIFSDKPSSKEVTKDFTIHIAVPLVSLPAAFFAGLYVGKPKKPKD